MTQRLFPGGTQALEKFLVHRAGAPDEAFAKLVEGQVRDQCVGELSHVCERELGQLPAHVFGVGGNLRHLFP